MHSNFIPFQGLNQYRPLRGRILYSSLPEGAGAENHAIGLLKNAVRELNLVLKRCLFVGDTLKDMRAGKRAGCRTVLVQTGQGRESLIKILSGKNLIRPDWVCNSLVVATPLILRNLESRY